MTSKDSKSTKVLAIIPARSGSKRFPNKNLYHLLGRPLLSYPITAASESLLIDRVIVSTDDNDIADVAKLYGAEVPFLRLKSLSTDKSQVIDAVIFTLEKLKDSEGYRPDYVILLQAVNPLVKLKQINEAIDTAINFDADSVISVTPVDTTSHPYNLRTISDDGFAKFWIDDLHYEFLNGIRPRFYKAANIWLSSYETIMEQRKFEGMKNIPIIVDSISAMDIDYKRDLELIEAYLQYGKQST